MLKPGDNQKKADYYLGKAEALQTDPEAIYLLRGDREWIAGQFQAAQSHYERALAQNPNSIARLQLDRHAVLTRQKPFDPAWLNLMKQGDPKGSARYWLGIFSLDLKKNPEDAIRLFTGSLKLHPNQPGAEGMRTVIRQWLKQKSRLQKKNVTPDRIPPAYLHLLNTRINEIRMELPLFEGTI